MGYRRIVRQLESTFLGNMVLGTGFLYEASFYAFRLWALSRPDVECATSARLV